MLDVLDKLVEYRNCVLKLEELRKKRGGKLRIHISPNVKITERWEGNGSYWEFFEKEFRIANIDAEIVRLKDNIKYYESKAAE